MLESAFSVGESFESYATFAQAICPYRSWLLVHVTCVIQYCKFLRVGIDVITAERRDTNGVKSRYGFTANGCITIVRIPSCRLRTTTNLPCATAAPLTPRSLGHMCQSL